MKNWIKNIFKKKPIIIPIITNGVKNGLWVECFKGDETYIKLVKIYGLPLPKTIETIPINKEELK
jgi:hypothetical protein